ncbi:glycosyltransferase [Sphingomonas parva]|uniref:Glycosyltransferase n=2 Tax=Sphingomonas parva TaxID=2555898 RepID=A0A4Y8ZVG3_9SPHN|nr:glycosyltransferase [Sphingomonas parva]
MADCLHRSGGRCMSRRSPRVGRLKISVPSEHEPGLSVLYITYDGLTDPLGRSQVLPYLAGLTKLGHRIHVLSCEKQAREASDGARIRALCEAAGIGWHPIRYHKSPPILSSVYDMAMLRRAAERLHRRHRFDVVHCRSYIPAMAGLHLKHRQGVRFLFDMRGFWPDERVEGHSWPQINPVFRAVYGYFKSVERRLLRGADHIISLTHAGKRQLLTRAELQIPAPQDAITVIPCCVDFDHFPLTTRDGRQAARRMLGLPQEARVVAYLGSLGSWYMLDEMLDFFRVCLERDANARFLFVTHDAPEPILQAARTRGIGTDRLLIRPASREEVPQFMCAADFGLFFIKPVFSKLASSPTKMGEMLALGLPVVTNSGVGDVAEIVEETGSGVAIDRFDDEAYREALERIDGLSMTPEMHRERALPWFDVELGIARYDRVYRDLAASAG